MSLLMNALRPAQGLLGSIATRMFGGGGDPSLGSLPPAQEHAALADAMFNAGSSMVEAAGGPRHWGDFAPSPLAAAFAGLAQGRQSYRQAQAAAQRRLQLGAGTQSTDPAAMRAEVQRLIRLGYIPEAEALAKSIPADQYPYTAGEHGVLNRGTGEITPYGPGASGLTWDQQNKVTESITSDYRQSISRAEAAAGAYSNLNTALQRMAANPGTNEAERTATGTVILKAFAALSNPAMAARLQPNASAEDVIGTGAISGVLADWFHKYIRGELSPGQAGTVRQAADDLARSNIAIVGDAMRQAQGAARQRGLTADIPLFNPWEQFAGHLLAGPGAPAAPRPPQPTGPLVGTGPDGKPVITVPRRGRRLR